jgi:DNA-binding transcriptional LysR family regulator
MNWDDLRIFDAAAASGSVSAGALTLGLSQSQMSRRLRDLEDQIGARLFDRTPQGLRPTTAGARLIPLTENMRKAADVIVRAKPDLASEQTTVVRISVDEIRQHFLTKHINALSAGLIDVQLEIFSGHEHLDHESRMTDIQVRSCLPNSETLIAKRIGETGYGIYGSKEFLAAHENTTSETFDCINQLPWIGISPDHLWYPLQLQWLEGYFHEPSKLRFNTMTGVFNAARQGAGLALLPHFMASECDDLLNLSVAKVHLETVEYLIVHRDLLREKAVRRTVDALTDLYRTHRNFLLGSD